MPIAEDNTGTRMPKPKYVKIKGVPGAREVWTWRTCDSSSTGNTTLRTISASQASRFSLWYALAERVDSPIISCSSPLTTKHICGRRESLQGQGCAHSGNWVSRQIWCQGADQLDLERKSGACQSLQSFNLILWQTLACVKCSPPIFVEVITLIARNPVLSDAAIVLRLDLD